MRLAERVRGASLRARLSRTLVGLGLVSVVLLAGVNFFVVRNLLDSGVRSQLVTLRDLRSTEIERGFDRLLDRVQVIADDPSVAAALVDLEDGFERIATELTPSQVDELEEAYAPVVGRYDDAGVERPPVDELMPADASGRYVQYHYVASDPDPDSERDELIDADDGSAYSAAHATHHEFLRAVADNIAATDLLLVAADTNEVIYSVEKRIDLGTDVVEGPYADTGLGVAVDRLAGAAAGEAVFADSAFYLPESSAPVLFVAGTVRSGREVVGAVVIGIPMAVVTDLVTEGGNWDRLGLGDTGDAYVVGADRRVRTEPRLWTDDPEEYVRRFDDHVGDERLLELIEFVGSPALLQPADNAAVETALDGESFVGQVDDPLGRSVLSAADAIDVPGLDWVLVTEQATSETRDELERFVVTIALVLLVLLPLLAVIGYALARALARPIGPLVDAAERIAGGDFDTDVPDQGRNEFGDLGRQLRGIAHQLQEQERSLAAEERRIEAMLESVVPPALVERIRRGEREVAEVVDTGTVIALRIRGLPEPAGAEQEALVDLTTRLADEVRRLADERRIERIRVASDQQLFVAGRGAEGAFVTEAADFAIAVLGAVEQVGREFGVPITGHVGLSAGPVATGVLGSNQVSFGMWGECVGSAIVLGSQAGAGTVLADSSVVGDLGDGWDVTESDADASDGGTAYAVAPRVPAADG